MVVLYLHGMIKKISNGNRIGTHRNSLSSQMEQLFA